MQKPPAAEGLNPSKMMISTTPEKKLELIKAFHRKIHTMHYRINQCAIALETAKRIAQCVREVKKIAHRYVIMEGGK